MRINLRRCSEWQCRIGILVLIVLAVAFDATAQSPANQQDGEAPRPEKTAAATPPVAARQPPRPLWSGTLDVKVREFRFVIETTNDADGKPIHFLRSLDEGDRRFRLDRFQDDGRTIEFELQLTRAAYSGQVADDKRSVAGVWKQAGAEFPLSFRPCNATPRDVPDEAWSGTLNLLVQKLELRFRIYEVGGGKQRVRMDSVTQQAGGFVADLRRDGSTWEIDVPGLKGKFTGQWNADRSVVDGKWEQNIVSVPLRLTKVDPSQLGPAKPPSRPQTPRPPFPYQVELVKVENVRDHLTLAGTLTLPHGDAPSGAVLLLAGSGPQDRDESIVDHKPLLVLADHLTRQGYVVLRCDKRGIGESTGGYATATSEDFARDAEAALEFLKAHPRVAARRVGIVGHSEGGLLGAMVAARRADVAWLVMLAGPGVNGERILLSQGQRILQSAKATEDDLKLQRILQTAMIEAVKETARDTEAAAVTAQAIERVRKEVPADDFEAHMLERTIEAGIQQMHSPWFRFFLTYEPAAALRTVRCPVLALNGDLDTQVDPALNLPAIELALREAKNDNFKLVRLPQVNHLFQTCQTGAVGEYQEIEETIAPPVLETLIAWLRQIK